MWDMVSELMSLSLQKIFIRNTSAVVSLQRMDGIEYNEVEIQLIHQELNDDTLGLRFMISDKKNNCEDFLNINVLI